MIAAAAPILAAVHWQYPRAATVAIPLLLMLSAYTVWAYVPQVRAAGRAWAWVLPGLRVATFAVVTVSLLRPAVTRTRGAADRGPVVVMVDDSRSMGVVDTGRPPGQRVAVAAALGRLPPGPRDLGATVCEADAERLAALADEVGRARSAVEYARLAGRDDDPANARLDAAIDAVHRAARATAADVASAGMVATPALDRSLSLLSAEPSGVDREAWIDRAGERARAAAVEAERSRVAADGRLYDDDPAVHDAADAVAGESRERLAWAAAFDRRAGLVARLGADVRTLGFTVGDRVAPATDVGPPSPDGTASDLAGGVRATLERLASTAAPGDEPPRAVVLLSDGRQVGGEAPESVAAAAGGVPVFTVAVAARAVSPNVAVTDLAVPPVVYAGEPAVCRATVRGVGVTGSSTDVTFAPGGNDDVQSQLVRFADDRPRAVSFTWVPRGSGPTEVTVRAVPVAGEATDADNVAERWARVVSAPVRVSVVAATDGWEFESAGQALARAAGVQVVVDGLVTASVPTAEQVAASDVVVLFGVTSRSLSPAQWDAITRLAGDRGGGVVLVAGPGGFGGAVPAASPLARLLPFAGAPPVWVDRPGTGARPTSDPDAPRLSADPAEDARLWAGLPPVDGYLPLAGLRPDARPLLVVGADDSPTPILAERRVGPGRALCLGTDRTWLWQSSDDVAGDPFWTALVRAAAGPPFAAELGGVALDLESFTVAPGQPVRARVRGDMAAVQLRVEQGGALVRMVPFTARSGGQVDVVIPGLPAGRYTVSAPAGPGAGPAVPLWVRPSFDAELADVSGDDGFLRRLSEATGGQSYRLDQLDALAAKLAAPPDDSARPVELPLWDGPYLVALVVGLLTAEWALRKRAGLA